MGAKRWELLLSRQKGRQQENQPSCYHFVFRNNNGPCRYRQIFVGFASLELNVALPVPYWAEGLEPVRVHRQEACQEVIEEHLIVHRRRLGYQARFFPPYPPSALARHYPDGFQTRDNPESRRLNFLHYSNVM
jgi:hypothetical protein